MNSNHVALASALKQHGVPEADIALLVHRAGAMVPHVGHPRALVSLGTLLLPEAEALRLLRDEVMGGVSPRYRRRAELVFATPESPARAAAQTFAEALEDDFADACMAAGIAPQDIVREATPTLARHAALVACAKAWTGAEGNSHVVAIVSAYDWLWQAEPRTINPSIRRLMAVLALWLRSWVPGPDDAA